MPIVTEVEYGFTFNAGKYQSERFSVRLRLDPDDTDDSAFMHAKAIVSQQRSRSLEIPNLERQIDLLHSDAQNAEYRVKEIHRRQRDGVDRYNKLRTLLEKHGVDLPELDSYYLPPPIEQPPDVEVDDAEAEEDDDYDIDEDDIRL